VTASTSAELGRYFTSRDLQLHHEAEAMAGIGVNRTQPALYSFLLRHLDSSKRERLARSEEARLKREARWREIADGERLPLSVLELPAPVSTRQRKAA
jgi:hypothetical protein